MLKEDDEAFCTDHNLMRIGEGKRKTASLAKVGWTILCLQLQRRDQILMHTDVYQVRSFKQQTFELCLLHFHRFGVSAQALGGIHLGFAIDKPLELSCTGPTVHA